jgi:hypothetical protein
VMGKIECENKVRTIHQSATYSKHRHIGTWPNLLNHSPLATTKPTPPQPHLSLYLHPHIYLPYLHPHIQEKTHPLYKYLKSHTPGGAAGLLGQGLKWNFAKFLCNAEGTNCVIPLRLVFYPFYNFYPFYLIYCLLYPSHPSYLSLSLLPPLRQAYQPLPACDLSPLHREGHTKAAGPVVRTVQ